MSASKDGLVKVWDLDTQHCCQTVAGCKAEVWALDANPQETRVVTGGWPVVWSHAAVRWIQRVDACQQRARCGFWAPSPGGARG